MNSDCSRMQREVEELKDLRHKFQLVVQGAKAKEAHARRLEEHNKLLRFEIEQLVLKERKAREQAKLFQELLRQKQLQTMHQDEQFISMASHDKKVAEIEDHYISQIKELEALLQRQSSVITSLEGSNICKQCEGHRLYSAEMGKQVTKLENQLRIIGQTDKVKQQLQQIKNKLNEVKRLQLNRIDQLFQQLQ